MKKILRMAGIASALVILLVVSIASLAMAAGPNPDPGTGVCPNPDCPNVCPNPDCPGDGDQLQYRNGPQYSQGGAHKHQYRACHVN
ncbi:MAG: hypothetical protein PHU23_05330 [Dehalococcoidales bacterium]|nr:hypothetical protein [Dehalococcoidales bacterium]